MGMFLLTVNVAETLILTHTTQLKTLMKNILGFFFKKPKLKYKIETFPATADV